MSKKAAAKLGRRDFFRKAGLGAGVAGAAAVGLSASKGQAAVPGKDATKGIGYQETEHVKKFYELAKF
ncbi:MAG: formate dehydrogenase [Alphaproteobacteria bacterium]